MARREARKERPSRAATSRFIYSTTIPFRPASILPTPSPPGTVSRAPHTTGGAGVHHGKDPVAIAFPHFRRGMKFPSRFGRRVCSVYGVRIRSRPDVASGVRGVWRSDATGVRAPSPTEQADSNSTPRHFVPSARQGQAGMLPERTRGARAGNGKRAHGMTGSMMRRRKKQWTRRCHLGRPYGTHANGDVCWLPKPKGSFLVLVTAINSLSKI